MTTKDLQRLVGTTPDGDFGAMSVEATKAWVDKLFSFLTSLAAQHPETRPKIDAFMERQAMPSPDPVPVPEVLHERTENNLRTLSPKTQALARRFIRLAHEKLPAGVEVRVISGTRSYEEQNELYAQGRTRPGPKVTNARGGYSNHNFGIAFDVGVFINGVYQPKSLWYEQLGPIGESVGLEWGGRWTSPVDTPHYQLKTGLSTAQLRKRKAQGLPIE